MPAILDRMTTKRYLMLLNFAFLAIHASLIVIFIQMRIMPMVYVNIASVVCYFICVLLSVREMMRTVVLITFTENIIHTILAVWFMGINARFQMYCLSCMSYVLFTHYFAVRIGRKYINGPLLSTFCCSFYILTIALAQSHSALYPLSYSEQDFLALYNSAVTFLFALAFFSLLTIAASRNQIRLDRQASHDNLTGLVNRHYLMQHMQEMQETGSFENYWLAILDIDNFKMINDQYGHLCGDFVLRSVAQVIQKCCSDQIVCRWGGEEFMVVGITPGQEDGMITLLEKIRTAVSSYEFIYDGNTKLHLTITTGMARYESNQSLNTWIDIADGRLYIGKHAGKDQVVWE